MELQAKDLRDGNYVYEDCEVREVTPLRIAAYNYEKGLVKPIRLTETWLLKFNYFKILDDLFHHETTSKKIDHSVHEKDGKFYSDSLFKKEIKYVHTLQNVYSYDVLTGEELTIK